MDDAPSHKLYITLGWFLIAQFNHCVIGKSECESINCAGRPHIAFIIITYIYVCESFNNIIVNVEKPSYGVYMELPLNIIFVKKLGGGGYIPAKCTHCQ